MYGSIFWLKRPRQKAEPLSRFHRRPRQDDAVHLLREQRAHRHGHGDVRLPGAARSDAEHHVVLSSISSMVVALAGSIFGVTCVFASERTAVRAQTFRAAIRWRFLRRHCASATLLPRRRACVHAG